MSNMNNSNTTNTLFDTYTASPARRYIPRGDFIQCQHLQRQYGNLRGIFRVLGSYAQPDRAYGAKYQPLSKVINWIDREIKRVDDVQKRQHAHFGVACDECRQAQEFFIRNLEVATQIVEAEQQKVRAEVEAQLDAGVITPDYEAYTRG